jgi:DNA-binding response OmpR family regulator
MPYKLLVVDDDPTLLLFLQEYFQNESFQVVTAANGAEALRLAYQEHPDLVVLDVMMPGMDGWEVTRRLREMSEVPIILVTAKNSEADKLHGFNLGIDDYVTKPFSFAELSARIQAILNRTNVQSPGNRNLLPIGNLVLDMNKFEARRGIQVFPLTPTEFRLLEALARRHGQAVSEAELVSEIWGSDRQADTAVVRRYIWLIRQKIEPDPANPSLILTVRGFGYRLETGK